MKARSVGNLWSIAALGAVLFLAGPAWGQAEKEPAAKAEKPSQQASAEQDDAPAGKEPAKKVGEASPSASAAPKSKPQSNLPPASEAAAKEAKEKTSPGAPPEPESPPKEQEPAQPTADDEPAEPAEAPDDEQPAAKGPFTDAPGPTDPLGTDETPIETPVEPFDAEEEEEAGASPMRTAGVALLIAGLIVIPFFIGSKLGNSLRMPDYGWKIGLVLGTLVWAAAIVYFGDITLGTDLRGGINLIYEVDPGVAAETTPEGQEPAEEVEEGGGQSININKLIGALSLRIDPGGVKEVTIRPFGPRQVEIIIPEADEAELELIKRKISTAGSLEFRITANRVDHAEIIELARGNPAREVTQDGEVLARWVKLDLNQFPEVLVNRADPNQGSLISLARASEQDEVRRADEVIAQWLTIDISQIDEPRRQTLVTREVPATGEQQVLVDSRGYILRDNIRGHVEVLVSMLGETVTGQDLQSATKSIDQRGRPAVNFALKPSGAAAFSRLTRANAPDPSGFARQLGIVLDNTLLSAPNLNEPITGGRGEITGNFSEEEVEFLINILNAGSLPTSLNPEPISEQRVGPQLGADTIRQGQYAIVGSAILVAVFMLIYYRFSGFLACLALGANFLLLLAVMVAIKAAFTLPGLAGLVLTIGMAVDANVLIFERIREELNRGSTLRLAIRNGFGRATTTIVDANITTLITAIVLYAIGTDQVKGFAVTLILGILMSMYTAIFCTRIVYDIAEKRRWIEKLSMMRIVSDTSIDFIGFRRIGAVCSILVIAVGLAGVVGRGKNLLDVDFLGGSSITLAFVEPQRVADVRSTVETAVDQLEEEIRDQQAAREAALQAAGGELSPQERAKYPLADLTVPVDISVYGAGAENLQFKVDSSIVDVDVAEKMLEEAFGDKLLRNSVQVEGLEEQDKAAATEGTSGDTVLTGPPGQQSEEIEEVEIQTSLPPDTLLAQAGGPLLALLQDAEARQEKTQQPAEKPAAEGAKTTPESAPDAKEPAPGSEKPEPSPEKPEPSPEKVDNSEAGEAAKPAEKIEKTEKTEATEKEPATEPPVPNDAEEAAPADDTVKDDTVKTEEGVAKEKEAAAKQPPAKVETRSVQLTFGEPVNHDSLTGLMDAAFELADAPRVPFELSNPNYTEGSAVPYLEWEFSARLSEEDFQAVVKAFREHVSSLVVFPSSSKIGGRVAQDTQQLAGMALMASLVCIVGYIWLRFQRLMFGLAAVVALLHDVLVTLGIVALSAYVVQYLPFIATPLMIDPFKISLPLVAAFLTIIGYSLNDTIVVFDRIREVRGKSTDITAGMINTSINQTLSRTLLTSITTLIVVLILYAAGGPGIHGFAFSLVVGVLVGTYSSIFVASPVLLWMGQSGGGTSGSGTSGSGTSGSGT